MSQQPVGTKGAADAFYNDPYAQQQAQQGLAPPPGAGMDGRYSPGPVSGERSGKRHSFLGKLFGKDKQQGQPQYAQQGYYPPQGAPYGYPQQPGYGAAPYMQPGRPGRRPGMGMGGAAAMGVGGGLLGGMMLGSALDGHDGHGHGGDWGDPGLTMSPKCIVARLTYVQVTMADTVAAMMEVDSVVMMAAETLVETLGEVIWAEEIELVIFNVNWWLFDLGCIVRTGGKAQAIGPYRSYKQCV